MNVTRTVIAQRVAEANQRELNQSIDAGLETVARAQRPRKRRVKRVKSEVKTVQAEGPVVTEPTGPITFVCNSVPALGIGLGGEMYSFQNGMLTLEAPAAIAEIRKHQWFGRKIFERIEMPETAPIPEEDPEAPALPRLQAPKASYLAQLGLQHIAVKETSLTGDIYRCALCRDVSPVFHTELDLARHARRLHVPLQNTQPPAARRVRTDVRAPTAQI